MPRTTTSTNAPVDLRDPRVKDSRGIPTSIQEGLLFGGLVSILRTGDIKEADRDRDISQDSFDEFSHLRGRTPMGLDQGIIEQEQRRQELRNPKVSIDQANEEGAELGLSFDKPIRRQALDIIIQRKKEELRRAAILQRYRSGGGFPAAAASTGAMFLGAMMDPLNIATAFIPSVAALRAGITAGRMGVKGAKVNSLLDKVASKPFLRGFTDGVIGESLIEPFVYQNATLEQRDYDLTDSFINLLAGGMLGGGIHVAGDRVINFLNRKAKARIEDAETAGEIFGETRGESAGRALPLEEAKARAQELFTRFIDGHHAARLRDPEFTNRLYNLLTKTLESGQKIDLEKELADLTPELRRPYAEAAELLDDLSPAERVEVMEQFQRKIEENEGSLLGDKAATLEATKRLEEAKVKQADQDFETNTADAEADVTRAELDELDEESAKLLEDSGLAVRNKEGKLEVEGTQELEQASAKLDATKSTITEAYLGVLNCRLAEDGINAQINPDGTVTQATSKPTPARNEKNLTEGTDDLELALEAGGAEPAPIRNELNESNPIPDQAPAPIRAEPMSPEVQAEINDFPELRHLIENRELMKQDLDAEVQADVAELNEMIDEMKARIRVQRQNDGRALAQKALGNTDPDSGANPVAPSPARGLDEELTTVTANNKEFYEPDDLDAQLAKFQKQGHTAVEVDGDEFDILANTLGNPKALELGENVRSAGGPKDVDRFEIDIDHLRRELGAGAEKPKPKPKPKPKAKKPAETGPSVSINGRNLSVGLMETRNARGLGQSSFGTKMVNPKKPRQEGTSRRGNNKDSKGPVRLIHEFQLDPATRQAGVTTSLKQGDRVEVVGTGDGKRPLVKDYAWEVRVHQDGKDGWTVVADGLRRDDAFDVARNTFVQIDEARFLNEEPSVSGRLGFESIRPEPKKKSDE